MRPLREEEGAVAALLRAAATPLPEEPQARARVGAKLFAPARSGAGRLLLAGALAAAAGVALTLWLLPSQVGAPVAALRPLAPRETLAGSTFALGTGGAASLQADRSVALRVGVLDVVATAPVEMSLGTQRVFAERASFRVRVSPAGDLAVLVFEGAVEVRGPQGSSRVTPERGWAQGAGVESAELLHREALALEREGQPARALAVLAGVVPHPGVWGELSLYDSARLELSRGERARAADLLAQHAARYPRGTLTVEVAALQARLRSP